MVWRAAPAPSAPFYMYTEPALDHRWLRHCVSFVALRHGKHGAAAWHAEKTAEVSMHGLLRRSPLRTREPAEARLFYVPIFEFASFYLDAACANATATPPGLGSHAARMAAARRALLGSPHWRRHRGRDHVYVSSASYFRQQPLQQRLGPLASVLGDSSVGRFKLNFPRHSAGGRCVVEVPYPASRSAVRAWAAARAAVPPPGGGGERKTMLLSFAGSFDVCCTGQQIRCKVADLYAAAVGQPDVVIRPSSRGADGPCHRRALSLAAQAANSSRRASGGLSGGGNATTRARTRAGGATPAVAQAVAHADLGAQMAREMMASHFCLVPPGDTCVTSRLYTAIAVGCLPVVLCDALEGAFPSRANYGAFWLKFPSRAWLRRPTSLLDVLRRLLASEAEMARRHRALADARAAVLYDEPGSRVGTHFLEGVVRRCRQLPVPPNASARGGDLRRRPAS